MVNTNASPTVQPTITSNFPCCTQGLAWCALWAGRFACMVLALWIVLAGNWLRSEKDAIASARCRPLELTDLVYLFDILLLKWTHFTQRTSDCTLHNTHYTLDRTYWKTQTGTMCGKVEGVGWWMESLGKSQGQNPRGPRPQGFWPRIRNKYRFLPF